MTAVNQYVEIDGQKISFDHLTNGNIDSTRYDQYGKDTLEFIQSWLQGKNEFAIRTSGSTGKPKLIKIPRDIMIKSAEMTIKALNLSRGDSALACINTGYIGGKMMLVRSLMLGMHLTIVKPSSNPFVQLDPGVCFDFVALVPIQLETILRNEQHVKILNKAKAIIVGGAPVSNNLHHELQIIEAPIYATYGMTETVSHIALRRLNGSGKDLYFKALPEVVIGQDERGCLTIKSAVTGGKKIITNDSVKIINDHEFEWLGRIDNVVNTGGIKVQLEELESKIGKIMTELGRNENFIIGTRDDRSLGQKLILLLEGREYNEEELAALVKKRLNYHAPREIIWVPGFVRTDTGKVNRRLTIKKYLS